MRLQVAPALKSYARSLRAYHLPPRVPTMVTQRAFLRFMFTAAPVLCILHMVQEEYVLALYALAIAPLAVWLAPYVCDE